jgi:hypothetical protein
MGAIFSSETLAYLQQITRYFPEDKLFIVTLIKASNFDRIRGNLPLHSYTPSCCDASYIIRIFLPTLLLATLGTIIHRLL